MGALQVLGHDISHNGHFLRRFLAISAAISYNVNTAENTPVLVPRYQLSNPQDCVVFQGALLALLKQACLAVSGREAKTTELQPLVDHWPLFYAGCLGCAGALKEWLVRTVAAALRKGDARLTLDHVREHELIEANLAQMATDIVAGEQQVSLTGGSREQLHSLLQMDIGAVLAPTSTGEASSTRVRRASTRPGTRKPKREAVGE